MPRQAPTGARARLPLLLPLLLLLCAVAPRAQGQGEFFVFRPIEKRAAPKDFAGQVSPKLGAALVAYQAEPSMKTAIGVLQNFDEFYKMSVEQRQRLLDSDRALFLSVDVAKYELVMQVRKEVGAKSSRRVGSTGQRELAIIRWRKGEGPEPELDAAKQFSSDDDVTNLTGSAELLADEAVNGARAEEVYRRITRERYQNELDPKTVQTEFLSPTKAWTVFKEKYGGQVARESPPPDFLYAWTAANPEKYNDPYGVYMLDKWGYDKGVVTGDVRDPLNTTRTFREVYDAPRQAPASGKFAYIADNYRQIYAVHHGRFESECKYLVRMIDAWEAVHGADALPPDWRQNRQLANLIYQKGADVEGAAEFRQRIKVVINEVVTHAHDYQLTRVADSLVAAFGQTRPGPEARLTAADLERHPQLVEELNGLLIAYTNVPDAVHEELMEQFRRRIAASDSGRGEMEKFRSHLFKHIMQVVQDETGFQKGNIEAFRSIRGRVSQNLTKALTATDLDVFLEEVARGRFQTQRLKLLGKRIGVETLGPQDVMEHVELIHAVSKAFDWPNEKYAARVKEYFAAGPDRGLKALQMLQRLVRVFDSTNARAVSVTFTDAEGRPVTREVVPARMQFGLKLFAMAVKGGETTLKGAQWWGNVTNGRDLYQNLVKVFDDGGSLTDLEVGQAQAALFANVINLQGVVAAERWKVPGAAVLTSNVVGSLSANAGAVGVDPRANDELLYAAFKDLAVLYQPHLAGVFVMLELGQWGYKEWTVRAEKHDLIDAMLENGVWEPADHKELKDSQKYKAGELPKLKGVRVAKDGQVFPALALARTELSSLRLAESGREFNPRETLLDLAYDGGYVESDPVIQTSVDALNELSGTWAWRKFRLGALPTNSRNWNREAAAQLGITIVAPEDSPQPPKGPEVAQRVTAKPREGSALSETQLRLMGVLMVDFWAKRQQVLEEAVLPGLIKEAARRKLDRLKAEEINAGQFDLMKDVEEVYTQVAQVDRKMWPRVARSADPITGLDYKPEADTPILESFKKDDRVRRLVGQLKELQDFLQSVRTEIDFVEGGSAGETARTKYDRTGAISLAGSKLSDLRGYANKLADAYEAVHGLLDQGSGLAKEGPARVEPFYVAFAPRAWSLAEVASAPESGGDYKVAKDWLAGYRKERRKALTDVAERTKAAPEMSILADLYKDVLRLLGRETEDTGGSPAHPFWPKLARLRYQIHTIRLMRPYVGEMDAREFRAVVEPMTVKDGEAVRVNEGGATAENRLFTLRVAEEAMEEEYKRTLDGLTHLFDLTVLTEAERPHVGQEAVVRGRAKLDPATKEALRADGFPAYVRKFRWTVEDQNRNQVATADTDEPRWNAKLSKAGRHRVRLAALDRGGNVVASDVLDGPDAQPVQLTGSVSVSEGDYGSQPVALAAGQWRDQAAALGPFTFQLTEYREESWAGANTVRAEINIDGTTYRSNESAVEFDAAKGTLRVKDELRVALPYAVTITVDVTDKARRAVPGVEASVLVNGGVRGVSPVRAWLTTGASLSSQVDHAASGLRWPGPRVPYTAQMGRQVTLKVELPVLAAGSLRVRGQLVADPSIQPAPRFTSGSVRSNFGEAGVGEGGSFTLTNESAIDLRTPQSFEVSRVSLTDASNLAYRLRDGSLSVAVSGPELDLGSIVVTRDPLTLRPIQAALFDYAGAPVPQGQGRLMIGDQPAAPGYANNFSGEYTFRSTDEEVLVEGGYEMPDGQWSVSQEHLSARAVNWKDPQPPPAYQMKLPFFLPGSLRVSGRTSFDGVPEGESAPGMVRFFVETRGGRFAAGGYTAGGMGFDFGSPAAVQLTEKMTVVVTAESGETKYEGRVETRAPASGKSVEVGEIVLRRQGDAASKGDGEEKGDDEGEGEDEDVPDSVENTGKEGEEKGEGEKGDEEGVPESVESGTKTGGDDEQESTPEPAETGGGQGEAAGPPEDPAKAASEAAAAALMQVDFTGPWVVTDIGGDGYTFVFERPRGNVWQGAVVLTRSSAYEDYVGKTVAVLTFTRTGAGRLTYSATVTAEGYRAGEVIAGSGTYTADTFSLEAHGFKGAYNGVRARR